MELTIKWKETRMNSSKKKLAKLRASMKAAGIDAYLIPNTDPHSGEYIPHHWRIVEWLTGFTGSAANVVVTKSFAGLWTDSRYFVQAEEQLTGSGFELMKVNVPLEPSLTDFLCAVMKKGSKVAVDGRIISISSLRHLKVVLKSKEMIFEIDRDLISSLWNNRPPMPDSVAFDHSVEFSGKDRTQKIKEVRERMMLLHVNYNLLTAVDDIMWLLNIRGNDVQYSPLLITFAIVEEDQVLFFTDEKKIPLKLAAEFGKSGIVILPYEEINTILSTLKPDFSILLTTGTTSAFLYNSIPEGVIIVEDVSIPTRLKAIKNSVEINNIRKAMIRDGVALTKFFFWLEKNIGSTKISELSAAEKLLEFRLQQTNCTGASFSTIAAYNEHGALPHYSATCESDSELQHEGIFLLDSGAQYLDGTTDITRTIALDRPLLQQKTDFTLVLKGVIDLALAKFPSGTRGNQIDMYARKALWENGMNYDHGTGHGVGFFLNVHEGPQSIGTGDQKTFLEPGMLISDEPALYREGKYGVRTENLMLCVEDEKSDFGQFLRFETVTLCYIDQSLIDNRLLDKRETEWLNHYHAIVYEKLGPLLTTEERMWLSEKTKEI